MNPKDHNREVQDRIEVDKMLATLDTNTLEWVRIQIVLSHAAAAGLEFRLKEREQELASRYPQAARA